MVSSTPRVALLVVASLASGHLMAQETPPADDDAIAVDHNSRSDYLSGLVVEFEEQLVESATARPRRLIMAPSTVTRLSGADIRRSGARFLTDAFRMASGVEVMRTSSTESNVSVRGFNEVGSSNQGMLALLDGRPVYNDFFGNALWDSINVSIDEIDQVEIIRGPGSFLYGPNAMHGVVSIQTRSPLDYERDLTSFSAAAGGYRSTLATGIWVRRTENAGLKTTISWDDIGQFDDGDESTMRKKTLKLHYEREFGEEHRIGLSAQSIV